MDSTSWRSAGMLVAAAVMLVVLRPVLGVAEVQAAELSGTVTDVTGGRPTGVAVEARPVGAAGPIQTASCAKTRLSGPLADEFSLRGERDRPIRPQDVGNAVRSSPII